MGMNGKGVSGFLVDVAEKYIKVVKCGGIPENISSKDKEFALRLAAYCTSDKDTKYEDFMKSLYDECPKPKKRDCRLDLLKIGRHMDNVSSQGIDLNFLEKAVSDRGPFVLEQDAVSWSDKLPWKSNPENEARYKALEMKQGLGEGLLAKEVDEWIVLRMLRQEWLEIASSTGHVLWGAHLDQWLEKQGLILDNSSSTCDPVLSKGHRVRVLGGVHRGKIGDIVKVTKFQYRIQPENGVNGIINKVFGVAHGNVAPEPRQRECVATNVGRLLEHEWEN
jgi:hypothetical protein